MKKQLCRCPFVRFILGGVVTLGLYCVVEQGQSQIYTLTHNNSIVQIDIGTSAGMYYWSVDGQNQLVQQWFWFRAGNTPEQSIASIGAPSPTQPNARTLYTSYNNGLYSVEVDYTLTGFTPGSGISDIGESITIRNLTASPLDFHFFQYSDFDLAGTVGGDVVQLGTSLGGLFNEAVQKDGTIALTETVATPGANHGEANFFNATLVKLNDALPTTLNDNAGPLGPGDVTWALQWDFTIAPGSSVGISKDKYLRIPEPVSSGLMVLGGLVGLRLLRRKEIGA